MHIYAHVPSILSSKVKLSVAYPSINQCSVVTTLLQVLVLASSLVCLRNLRNVVSWVGNDVMHSISEAVKPTELLGT